MGRKPGSCQETNTDRASRVRDNKRRHRARQKEYVLDLERRVVETREQGVQVTKEVQLAAQKIARENAKLRDLLRRAGYTDNAIDAWVMSEKSTQKVASASESQRGRKLEGRNVGVEGEPGCTKSSSPPQYPDSAGAPCKLLTLLAKNPAADITQVPFSTESDSQPCKISKPEDCSSEGVECSTAYKMLMQYATSDERMDKIAAALEIGCMPSVAGGCKVKKSVVWKALDEECT